ncbi:MAG: methionine biosynthesis protein MetW [Deltaproteobacteria bacterium]|nr:methionine biosynthesis protein MetW [Deltaproteobacteria bacterium]
MTSDSAFLRYDLRIISSWIKPGSKVISLGCGDGDLLVYLKQQKAIKETGIEISEQKAASCIEKGLSVIQGDVFEEVDDYPDNAFDYVILSQTLQQVYDPKAIMAAMLRIGRKGIVSFPNFGHWRIRSQLLLTGRAPVSSQLPYQWYDSPNIRVLTIRDFREFSRQAGFRILREIAINTHNEDRSGRIVRLFPNLFATYGVFLIGSTDS